MRAVGLCSWECAGCQGQCPSLSPPHPAARTKRHNSNVAGQHLAGAHVVSVVQAEVEGTCAGTRTEDGGLFWLSLWGRVQFKRHSQLLPGPHCIAAAQDTGCCSMPTVPSWWPTTPGDSVEASGARQAGLQAAALLTAPNQHNLIAVGVHVQGAGSAGRQGDPAGRQLRCAKAGQHAGINQLHGGQLILGLLAVGPGRHVRAGELCAGRGGQEDSGRQGQQVSRGHRLSRWCPQQRRCSGGLVLASGCTLWRPRGCLETNCNELTSVLGVAAGASSRKRRESAAPALSGMGAAVKPPLARGGAACNAPTPSCGRLTDLCHAGMPAAGRRTRACATWWVVVDRRRRCGHRDVSARW